MKNEEQNETKKKIKEKKKRNNEIKWTNKNTNNNNIKPASLFVHSLIRSRANARALTVHELAMWRAIFNNLTHNVLHIHSEHGTSAHAAHRSH